MVLLTQFRPPKKPCELAVPSVACPKMLKTFTNLSILTFILGWMRNRWRVLCRLVLHRYHRIMPVPPRKNLPGGDPGLSCVF